MASPTLTTTPRPGCAHLPVVALQQQQVRRLVERVLHASCALTPLLFPAAVGGRLSTPERPGQRGVEALGLVSDSELRTTRAQSLELQSGRRQATHLTTSHLVEAGLAQAAAEGGVAGAGQRQGPLRPVPLELASLSVDVCRGAGREEGGDENREHVEKMRKEQKITGRGRRG